jgi:hypothetical protein
MYSRSGTSPAMRETAAMASAWPLGGTRRATMITASSPGAQPSAARVVSRGPRSAGSKRARSTVLGSTSMRSRGTPSSRT